MLKSPFVVHPKTGKICVPLDPARAHEFDPDGVPTVLTLQRELDAEITRRREQKEKEGEEKQKEGGGEEEKKEDGESAEGEEATAMDVDGAPKKRRRLDDSGSSSSSSSGSSARSMVSATALAPYVKFFRETFVSPMAVEQRANFRRAAEAAATEVNDW